MKKITRALIAAGIAPLCAWAAEATIPASEKSLKIVGIDAKRIMSNEVEFYKEQSAQFQKRAEEITKTVRDLEESIKRERSDLQDPAKAKFIDQAKRASKEKELEKMQINLKVEAEDAQRAIYNLEQGFGQMYSNYVAMNLEAFAVENDYDVILPPNTMYLSERVDVTDKFIAAINKKYAADKAKKAEPTK